MTRFTYPVILHPTESGTYSVLFPDLDGCISAGDTQAEALVMAEEALSLHLEGMLADGDYVPPADFDRDLNTFDEGPVEGQILGVVAVELVVPERERVAA